MILGKTCALDLVAHVECDNIAEQTRRLSRGDLYDGLLGFLLALPLLGRGGEGGAARPRRRRAGGFRRRRRETTPPAAADVGREETLGKAEEEGGGGGGEHG